MKKEGGILKKRKRKENANYPLKQRPIFFFSFNRYHRIVVRNRSTRIVNRFRRDLVFFFFTKIPSNGENRLISTREFFHLFIPRLYIYIYVFVRERKGLFTARWTKNFQADYSVTSSRHYPSTLIRWHYHCQFRGNK